MKSKRCWIGLVLIVLVLLTACGRTQNVSDGQKNIGDLSEKQDMTLSSKQNDSTGNKDGEKETQQEQAESTSESLETGDQADSITPSQLLCYFLGNSDAYSFNYKAQMEGTTLVYEHFYKDGVTALLFDAIDINGKVIKVKEIEKNGRVYYVIPEKNKVVSYKSPTTDLLLNEMQQVCMNPVTKSYVRDHKYVYEYQVPFVQDESILITYRFTMSGDQLEILEVVFGSDPVNTQKFTFSEIQFETVDDAIFEVPEGLEVTDIDSEYYPDEIPPWFE